MHDLMDDFARILATPMPRRKAFKLFGGALAAAAFGLAGVRSADAAEKCPTGQVQCGTKKICCPKGYYLCNDQCSPNKIASQQCTASKC